MESFLFIGIGNSMTYSSQMLLTSHIGYLYNKIGRRLIDGFTLRQLQILALLFENRAPTLGFLADKMGCSHQSIKDILLPLERKGFIDILCDNTDKRRYRVVLTQPCVEYFKNKPPKVILERYIKDLFAGIDGYSLSITVQTIEHLIDNCKEI